MKGPVPVETVLAACEDYLESRRQRIFNDQRDLVNEVMKQDQRNLWQRLLQHPPIYLDPNQAEEMLKKERGDTCWGYSQWDLITLRGEGAAKRAENIQRLAREVPSESWMDLTDDDAFLFNSHIWLAKRNS